MVDIVPLKVVKTTGNTTGLAEAQTGETVGISHGGTGQTTRQASINALTDAAAASAGDTLQIVNGNAVFAASSSSSSANHEFNMANGII